MIDLSFDSKISPIALLILQGMIKNCEISHKLGFEAP